METIAESQNLGLHSPTQHRAILIPASTYILWPSTTRVLIDGVPVIGWAHGASGGFGECAPSDVHNEWYQFTALYTLALQGYVVVAPDYAGLDIDRDTNRNIIGIHILPINLMQMIFSSPSKQLSPPMDPSRSALL